MREEPKDLWLYEREAFAEGYQAVCGVDEAGRGPLAVSYTHLTHGLLCIAGLFLLKIWPGTGGVFLTVIYIVFGNLPFLLIQRYNRPRLQKLLARQTRRTSRKEA